MTQRLRVVDGVLLTSDGQRIGFPVPLVQLIDWDDVVIVRGEGVVRYFAGNIWGLNRAGDTLWRVTDQWPLDSEFTELRVQDGKLVAFNFNGYRCVIEPRTGAVAEQVFSK